MGSFEWHFTFELDIEVSSCILVVPCVFAAEHYIILKLARGAYHNIYNMLFACYLPDHIYHLFTPSRRYFRKAMNSSSTRREGRASLR